MGNCFSTKSKISTAEIAYFDFIKSILTDTAPSSSSSDAATVRLFGSPYSTFISYLHIALLYKSVSLNYIPSDTFLPVLRIGSETVSVDSVDDAARASMLETIEARFPREPRLVMRKGEAYGESTPLVVRVVVLQHKSVMWHLERMVRWAQDLSTRGGGRRSTAVDPAMGSPKMEVKKFGRSYAELLELMMEHAQMEERVVFPLLEMADRGLCKAANEEHARDLPIMNGIKEVIKSIEVMDPGSPAFKEALSNLSARLKSLRKHCKEHFDEEERDVLPLIEAVELSNVQEFRVVGQCLDVMQGAHSRLFSFLVEGLLPREAMQYLDLIIRCRDEERAVSIIRRIIK